MNKVEKAIESLFEKYSANDEHTKTKMSQMSEVVHLEAGDILERAGDVTSAFYLIVEGVVRYFYSLEEGKERNKAFFKEGQLAGSLSAFFTDRIMPFTIDALEPCTLLRFPFQKLNFEGDLERIMQGATREILIRNEQHESTLLTGSAEDRYRWVESGEPWLLERIPQYHLASYLRLEPVSLSRVKSKLSNGS